MNVSDNHLIEWQSGDNPPEDYTLLPEYLNRAARRKLGKENSAYVSKTSGGKLSKWAAKMRKAKRGG
jgi:hypothetical protein